MLVDFIIYLVVTAYFEDGIILQSLLEHVTIPLSIH